MELALKRLPWASVAALSCLLAQQSNPTEVVPPGTVGADGAYRVGNGVMPPTVLTRVGGAIPDLARQVRASGDVLLSMVIQAGGSVRDCLIVNSAGYGMDERAIEAIRKWRFKAGTR